MIPVKRNPLVLQYGYLTCSCVFLERCPCLLHGFGTPGYALVTVRSNDLGVANELSLLVSGELTHFGVIAVTHPDYV